MRYLRKQVRDDAYGLDCLLQHSQLVAPGVVALKNGGLLAAWRYEGIDYGAQVPEIAALMRNHVAQQMNHGRGWVLETHVMRRSASSYPTWGSFPDPLSELLEVERKTAFEKSTCFRTDKYLSLAYFPVDRAAEKVRGWFYEDQTGEAEVSLASLSLAQFEEACHKWERLCSAALTMERLGECTFSDSFGTAHLGSDLMRFVRYAVMGEDRPFLLPPGAIDLDALIPTGRITGGMAPILRGKHLRVISVEAFPELLFPCATRVLEDLPMELRFHVRANLLSREEAKAVYTANAIRHGSKIRSFANKLMHKNMRPTEHVNQRAVDMKADALAAANAVENANEHTALMTATIILLRDDLDELNRDTVLIEQALNESSHLGIRIEEENAIDAWNGSLPGHAHCNLRRWPLRTYNVASLMPIHSIWTGHQYSPHPKLAPKSPPLLVAMTTGNTAYRHNVHISDVGHTICVGPTGNGKTTLEGLHAASILRYPGSRVILFDRRRTKYVLTKALGGEFFDYASASGPKHCPLQYLDTESDCAWAAGYIETLCTMNKLEITALHREHIGDAIERMRHRPDRSLTHFVLAVRDTQVREAMQLYTLANPISAGVLDAERDTVASANVVAYEMQHLLDLHPAIATGVLLHLFRRTRKSTSTNHVTAVFLDEAGELLPNEFIARQIESDLIGLRNQNGFVWLSFQDIHQITSSSISAIIRSQCRSEFWLPNAKAHDIEVKQQYADWGLNDVQIARIQAAVSKRDYFWRSTEEDRDSGLAYKNGRFVQMRLELESTPVARSILGANSDADRALCDTLMARHGAQWRSAWMRAKGEPEWAAYYEDLLSKRNELEEVVA